MSVELERKLGAGAFVERYVGRDTVSGRALLVTVPKLSLRDADDALRARILGAARRHQGLVHPHICTPVLAGITESGELVIAQELPPGVESAATEVLPEPGIERLVHLCEGLAYAHARGMVHGALTSDCIFHAGAEGTRIADFGVGLSLYEAGILGSRGRNVSECSPEVRAGAEPAPTADVYSLGVIGIQLCSSPQDVGTRPTDDSLTNRAQRIASVGLASILARAIESDPSARYATAEEMLDQLRLVVAHRAPPPRAPIVAKPRKIEAAQPARVAVPEMSYLKAFGLLAWLLARNCLVLVLAMCLIAAACAGGLALAFRNTPALVTVPSLEGKTVTEATKLAESKGLRATISREVHHDKVPAGHVVEHLPYPGKLVRQGRLVELVVSMGPAQAKVPNLVGKSRSDARKILESVGLRLGTVSYKPDASEPADQVIGQNPVPGKECPIDTEVNVIVSGNRRVAMGSSFSGPRAADVSFVVPEGPVVQRVRIEVHYPNGRYTVAYERVHRPGDKQTVRVLASGDASVQIFIDGELVREYDLVPSPREEP